MFREAAETRSSSVPAGALGWSLFGFNMGVEIGQLAIVGVFFPLAYGMRNSALYRRGVLTAGSAVIALVALIWFGERAFNLKLFPV